MAARNTRRRKKRRSMLYAPLTFLLICAVMVFGMSVFFHVSEIEVVGNAIYSAEEIVEASEIEKGDNLIFINRISAVSRIYSKLAYIEKASVRRELPNRLIIEVTESSSVAYVSLDGELWLIDKNCKLLGKISRTETMGLIEVRGITPVEPRMGEKLDPGEGEGTKVTYLSSILSEILTRGMQGYVLKIDMSNVMDAEFDYLGRFRVHLGTHENTEYKFSVLLSAVSQLSSGDSGSFDLSIDNRAHFTPD